METFVLAMIAIVVCILTRYCFVPLVRYVEFHSALSKVPYPEPAHWLLGHLPTVLIPGSYEERYKRWLKKGRRLWRVNLLIVTEITLVHPETAAAIFKSSEPKGKQAYRLLHPWLGQGLLVSAGKRWARDRRLLTRGFHFDILRGYLPVYKEAVGIMLDQWAEASHQDGNQTVNVSQCSKLLTLDIILRCIMSYESYCQTGDAQEDILEYVEAVLGLTECITQRNFSPLQHFDTFFALSSNGRRFYRYRNICHRVSQRLMQERKEVLAKLISEDNTDDFEEILPKKTSRRYLDFLDILLTVKDEDGKGLSDKEIQEQVDTFLFEGHDTTASALQWTLYYLAAHPDLQEKCRQEVQGCLDESRELSFENLNQLPYLTQFIKESMRLSSPVPYGGRTLTRATNIGGYCLPEGAQVTLGIFALHRHPDVWDRPLDFNPDRFSVENSAKRHLYAFVPFSAGPRNCIGQTLAMDELKTVLSLILLRFRLSVWDGYVKPKIQTLIVSRSQEDIEIIADCI